MYTSSEIKNLSFSLGAEKCGISSVNRFSKAPDGFHPGDIYLKCKSVIVYLVQMPTEIILASNPVPYSHTAYLIYSKLDKIGLELCKAIQNDGNNAVPVPSDVPYLYWDNENSHGMGILSLRHAGYLAGLGLLGRNNLLINPELGNMVYIGAILTDIELESDPVIENINCPTKCRICLDSCPQQALDGLTVNQKLCREFSGLNHERGFSIYTCNDCRKVCIFRTGIKSKKQAVTRTVK
jgi:epoxyqueuosine reductase QueG